jgi:hypothetical protein
MKAFQQFCRQLWAFASGISNRKEGAYVDR